VPVAVLLTVTGLQVPVIPLFEVVGNTGAAAPEQIAANGVNVGVILELVINTSVAIESHPAAFTSVTL
jgi:hypothetical protein